MIASMKSVGKVLLVLVGFGLWVVACPEVETYRDGDGRCWEASTYAAVYVVASEVRCR